MSEKEHRYVQFPLVLLSWGKSIKERLHLICSYCIIEKGRAVSRLLTDKQIDDEIRSLKNDRKRRPYGLVRRDHLLGLVRLGLTGGNADEDAKLHEKAEFFEHACRGDTGRRSPQVRLRWDLFWDTHNGKMTYQDFSVYCAYLSVIGSKKYVWVSRNRAITGALGYPGSIFGKDGKLTTAGQNLIKQREDGAWPFSVKELRTATARLVRKGLLHRFSKGERTRTLYSSSSTAMEMAEFAIKRAQNAVGNINSTARSYYLAEIERLGGHNNRGHNNKVLQTQTCENGGATIIEGPGRGQMGASEGPDKGHNNQSYSNQSSSNQNASNRSTHNPSSLTRESGDGDKKKKTDELIAELRAAIDNPQ